MLLYIIPKTGIFYKIYVILGFQLKVTKVNSLNRKSHLCRDLFAERAESRQRRDYMIISHKLKVIYIALAKVAGTSFQIALSKYCGPDDIIASHGKKGKFLRHSSASLIKSLVPPDVWNNYLKVATIRCPYDSIISGYFYRKHMNYFPVDNFSYFIARKYHKNTLHGRMALIHINGKIVTDFLIRYEHLDEDIRELERRINCPGLLQTFHGIKENKNLRPSGTSSYEMFSKYPEAKLLIDDHCRKNIDKYEATRKYWQDYKTKLETAIRNNNSAAVEVPRYFFLKLMWLNAFRKLRPIIIRLPQRMQRYLSKYRHLIYSISR